ncbi:MAG: alpha/beta-hydrolase family protein [Candidatus Nanopelagicales bacterium]
MTAQEGLTGVLAEAVELTEVDTSARAGLFLGAMAIGASFQPNLLTRATRDQAIISGLSTATAYGVATVGSSLLKSLEARIPYGTTAPGEAVLTALGFGYAIAVPIAEHESDRRAAVRLGALLTGAIGASSLASRLSHRLSRGASGRRNLAITAGIAAVTAGATYFALGTPKATVGAQLPDGTLFEDTSRTVKPGVAVGVAAGVTGLLLGIAHWESFASRKASQAAARIFGGDATDHVTFGRMTALATSAVVVTAAGSKVVNMLTTAGEGTEVAHSEPPNLPEVTGSAASTVPWSAQSREGRRWLSSVLTAGQIEALMDEPAKQPIRAYASLQSGATDEERAAVVLAELDRTKAFERSAIALFSPTGSGYVNYVASETFEYLTRGDCASFAIEYSVLPSSFSLQAVPLGTRQTRLVVNGIVERLLKMDPQDRPKFFMFGESLGSQVSENMFDHEGASGPRGIGLDAGLWIGTPSATVWRKQLWGERSIADPSTVGPADVYLPRSVADWHALPDSERAKVRFLLLQNGDDPIPKFGTKLIWRQPDWLRSDEDRPIGAPKGTKWVPFITFVQTFIDMLNALTPTPGIFAEGGHDYRLEIPEAIRTVWGFDAADDQMTRVQDSLRRRELHWEALRAWDEAGAVTDAAKRAKAETKAREQIGRWLGNPPNTPASDAQLATLRLSL